MKAYNTDDLKLWDATFITTNYAGTEDRKIELILYAYSYDEAKRMVYDWCSENTFDDSINAVNIHELDAFKPGIIRVYS